MAPNLLGHRSRPPCQGPALLAHTGPDLRVGLGLGDRALRAEVAGSGPTLTFTPAWALESSPARPAGLLGAGK